MRKYYFNDDELLEKSDKKQFFDGILIKYTQEMIERYQ
jgi:hypothetical protein